MINKRYFRLSGRKVCRSFFLLVVLPKRINPIIGTFCRQSSEKYFANRRKIVVKSVIMVYNITEVNGNEVF